jgi:hypothetical protein
MIIRACGMTSTRIFRDSSSLAAMSIIDDDVGNA